MTEQVTTSQNKNTLAPVLTDEQKIIERIESQEKIVKPIIESLFPEKTSIQLFEDFALKHNKTTSELDDNDKKIIFRNQKRNLYNKENLIYRLSAKTNISDTELPEYISTLYNFTTNFTPADSEFLLTDMTDWMFPCDTTERTRFHQGLAEQWKTKFMLDVDEPTARQRMKDFQKLLIELTGCNTLTPNLRNEQITIELFTAFTELYEKFYSVQNQQYEDGLDETFITGTERVGLIFNNPEQIRFMLQLYKELSDYPDRKIGKKFAETVVNYASNHGLSAEKIKGLTDKLLPAMQNNDPQVEIILKMGNIWGMKKGDFGIGDYLCHAYASPINPANLNELLLVAREVPTTGLSRLEQNRKDALLMVVPFGVLRDFIHDQRPYVHEVLTAMVSYYDTGDGEQLKQVLSKTDYLNQDTRIETILDRSNYDLEVEEKDKPGIKIKSIDILRRLVQNTKPVIDNPPILSDEQLNQKLQTLDQELIDKGRVMKDSLAPTVDYINQQLITMMNDKVVGIEPNYVIAISWVERRTFEVLQNMSYEDQTGAYQEKWFASLLKFQELIGSPKFDEQQFQTYLQSVTSQKYSEDAYKLISAHTLKNIRDLTVGYKQKGRTDTGALWSGNTAHELIDLTEFKPAKTEQGRKIRDKKLKQIADPGYHSGD